MTIRRTILRAGLGVAAVLVAATAAAPAYADPNPNPPPHNWPSLRNVGTQLCLEAAGTTVGSVARPTACNRGPAQRWVPTTMNDTWPRNVQFTSQPSALCLQGNGTGTSDDATLKLGVCADYTDPSGRTHDYNQEWRETVLSDGTSTYTNVHSAKCLSVIEFTYIPPTGGRAFIIRMIGQIACNAADARQHWAMTWS